jgi:hypothetical protein
MHRPIPHSRPNLGQGASIYAPTSRDHAEQRSVRELSFRHLRNEVYLQDENIGINLPDDVLGFI